MRKFGWGVWHLTSREFSRIQEWVGGLFDFRVTPNPNWSFGSSFGCGVWQYETLKHKRQKMNHKILECKWNNPL